MMLAALVALTTLLGGAAAQNCAISSMFTDLTLVTTSENCRAGCAEGTGVCPDEWYPGQDDSCDPECGLLFEHFWDECGDILNNAGIGGMDEMGNFYQNCLGALYPPGSCGTFCNEHTYQCYLTEVQEACCDEGGTNCVEGQDVPNECPVGCALVFPEFLDTCHDHIDEQDALEVADFDTFAAHCLEVDGLELVEYALDLQRRGCTIDLNGDGHRRRIQMLGQWLGSTADECGWDTLNDLAREVDQICCGAGGDECVSGDLIVPPDTCAPACAVAMHDFHTRCQSTMTQILGDRFADVGAFEDQCLEDLEANGELVIEAIRNAICPDDVNLGGGEEPEGR